MNQISESEKTSIQHMTNAFSQNGVSHDFLPKLQAIMERNATNNPDFSHTQPFIAHDLATQQAFIYYPDGSVDISVAYHGE